MLCSVCVTRLPEKFVHFVHKYRTCLFVPAEDTGLPPRKIVFSADGVSVNCFYPAMGGLQIPRWLGSDPLSAWWLGLASATLEFWVRFPNERNQGKQEHPVLKYRVPQRSHFTQSPYPPCSPERDGQTSPHRLRLVVSRSTCPPLSSPPHTNNFAIGPVL